VIVSYGLEGNSETMVGLHKRPQKGITLTIIKDFFYFKKLGRINTLSSSICGTDVRDVMNSKLILLKIISKLHETRLLRSFRSRN